jgi:hypothetical protein
MAWRWKVIGRWLGEFIVLWPLRLISLLRWLLWIDRPVGRHRLIRWMAGLACGVADLAPLAWVAESVFLLAGRDRRVLDHQEMAVARKVFGQGLDPSAIVIAGRSRLARQAGAAAFVSFHTIHAHVPITEGLLVHELVHCRQYRAFGSRYIPEALWAQQWGGGYDFGGTAGLLAKRGAGGLAAFNAEQQAEILERWHATRGREATTSRAEYELLGEYHREMMNWPG